VAWYPLNLQVNSTDSSLQSQSQSLRDSSVSSWGLLVSSFNFQTSRKCPFPKVSKLLSLIRFQDTIFELIRDIFNHGKNVAFWSAAAVGISSLHFTNMNKTRNLFIIGFTLYMGFSVPFYFYQYRSTAGYGPAHTGAGWVSYRSTSLEIHAVYPTESFLC
jgi:hypothetical protein